MLRALREKGKMQEYIGNISRDENLRIKRKESVIQSEVSQKEKNKYCMLTHIYGI